MWDNNNIRQDCFWYRPWHDMSATIDQCNFAETAECPCNDDCKWYIANAKVDEIIWSMLQTKQEVIRANNLYSEQDFEF